MAEHTPGPWEVRPIPGMNQIAIAQPGMMYPFASVGPWQDSREPNRKLTGTDYANALLMMKAAPDLLKALRDLLDWGREHTSPRDANSPHELLIAAVNAIAEAAPSELEGRVTLIDEKGGGR